MGKSIRSKIKRKHRKEFRETIGADAAKVSMTIVQSKLKEVLDKGSLNSLDRLSVVLQTNELCETETGNEPMDDVLPYVVDVEEEEPVVVAKGENRVPTKKRKHQKYRLQKKPMEERKGRTKPRFYCEF